MSHVTRATMSETDKTSSAELDEADGEQGPLPADSGGSDAESASVASEQASGAPAAAGDETAADTEADEKPEWRAMRLREIVELQRGTPTANEGIAAGPDAGALRPADSAATTDPPPPPRILGLSRDHWLFVGVAVAFAGVLIARSMSRMDRNEQSRALRTIHLEVRAQPDETQLLLDAQIIVNPYVADVTAGGTHLIEASASGYSSSARWVTFDQDRVVDVVLVARDP